MTWSHATSADCGGAVPLQLLTLPRHLALCPLAHGPRQCSHPAMYSITPTHVQTAACAKVLRSEQVACKYLTLRPYKSRRSLICAVRSCTRPVRLPVNAERICESGICSNKTQTRFHQTNCSGERTFLLSVLLAHDRSPRHQ